MGSGLGLALGSARTAPTSTSTVTSVTARRAFVVVSLVISIAVGYGVAQLVSSPARGVTQASSPAPATASYPTLHPGQGCPATPGRLVNNAYFGGYELGQGPVRMLIANAGNLRRGIVYIVPADKNNPLGPAAYYAFQNFWYSLPSFKRTWTVTARRLDGAGSVLFGNSDPTPTARPVPADAPQEFGPGYRSGVGSTWVNAPGCYGFQVSGDQLREVIVVDVILR